MKLPPPQQNYKLAFEIAAEKLRSADLEEVCRRSGARRGSGVLGGRFLRETLRIFLPQVAFQPELPLIEQVITLRYLINASGMPPTGRWISFSDLPGGAPYFPAFRKRVVEPLLKCFSEAGGKLVEAAKALGGEELDYGDVGVVFQVFPKVKVAFVLWEGDEEVPSNANVLFDESVRGYLSPDDLRELGWRLVYRMIKEVRHAPHH